MEVDVNAAGCELDALHIAVARLSHEDAEHVGEACVSENGAELRASI